MALRDTIRTNITRARALLIAGGLMPTVQWRRKLDAPDETGGAQHDAPVNIYAVVEDADVRVLTRAGVETPVRAQVTVLDPEHEIRANDLIILPSGEEHVVVRAEPSVLDVDGDRFITQVWLA